MFSTWGALTGLAISIILIVRKVTPAYALVLGALVGGLLGGGPVMPVRSLSPAVFVDRGGYIPAPMQSLKN